VPPPPIPPWILFSPAILITSIIAVVMIVSWAATRAGRPIPRIRPAHPAFRPTIIQGGKADAPATPVPEPCKRAG